ncbi:carboxypeptidase-like regulatory domain-containing protein [Labilibacter marinus]|uniref:carboxypeptidase-like regulatory domain-containing protein n=1 Tax=Labilibacter marinus TaxID=1477105 RepID=UPI0013019803|nr:carboxypeptidase-like regulatory domain-containing protein [Labilibacter marinus]
MKKQKIFLVLILITFPILGQSTMIKGKIKDKKLNSLLAVNIVNINTKESCRTDKNGSFKINAEIGDTLKFSYIGLTDETIIITNYRLLKLIMVDKSVNCLGAEWSKRDYQQANRKIDKEIKKLYKKADLKEIWE